MNFLNFILGLSFSASIVSGASRYLAIPIDGIDIIEVNPMTPQRVARQAETYLPTVVTLQRGELDHQMESRIDRSHQPILDYVDFGAQSGANGAFSWFADYPAHH